MKDRYQVHRHARRLGVVDCVLDREHPEAGVAICYIGGDADAEIVKDRADLVCAALNAVAEEEKGAS